ncbi:ATP-binding protein [Sphingobacterium corticibacterium]|uniref:ATP-binding protein n=1 Tax=Sphingobacterium corticibacterium TaxID=2484746 RepID=A0A4Q6XZA0_9SPHI|nr:ATP-binding protein [Sphingobacterium corticibacterium]RZF62197.1 ATP-binding protein [Sphingobacterium corticibacterium]
MSTQTSTHNIKAKSHILSLLGDELIGSDSLAIFELVKNAYDADAEEVIVEFINLNQSNQQIIIEDDGHGMTNKIIQDVWLTIGTDFKRGKNRKESKKFNRVSFGNKGVGRLAVHKLAKKITLETQAEGEMFSSRLTIDWAELIASKEYIQDLEVALETIADQLFKKGKGTRIILDKLTTKKWTKKALKDLVRKIDNIKNPFSPNPNFNIKIKANDFHQEWISEVTKSNDILKDSLYQFGFKIKVSDNAKETFAKFLWRYSFNPPSQTGISKRTARNTDSVNLHIGELYKDLDGEEEYNRYLRNKDLIDIGIIKGKFYVFNQNSILLKMDFGGQINAVKQFIKDNSGVKIFRDNIRVYNYGEPYDDWLGLDLDKIQRAGDHFGKKVTIGAIELNLKLSNDGLIEKTNREGFIDNIPFNRFQLLVKEVFNFFEREAGNDKDSVEAFLEQTRPVKKIGFGETIKELESKIKDKNLEKELAPLLIRVDKDYTEMRDIMVNSGMTGLNLGVAFHEVDREIRFINADLNSNNVDIEEVKDKVRNLIQILESLSPILRQNKSSLSSAKKVVEIAKKRNSNRFNFHKIVFSSPVLTEENEDFSFKVPTNLLISAISNIIDNAIYWTRTQSDFVKNVGEQYKPAIYIGTDLFTFEGPSIIIADNGPGFSSEPEYLTQPFKTKKEGGMGLGLYFADLVMNMIGGKLLFPDNSDLEIPKVYNGACIALVFPK